MRRNFHYGENKAQREARWMQQFADATVAVRPEFSGRIDWETAKYLMGQGIDPVEAGKRYALSREPETRRF